MAIINKAFLLIGGNEGDRLSNLKQAAALIEDRCGDILQYSDIYETAPWGNADQPPFLNQALGLESLYEATALMEQLLMIEEEMGRKRTVKYGPRTIDIDILLFNNEIYKTPSLTIPHEALPERRFALQPLADIAEKEMHPVLHKSIGQLLAECPDKLAVQRLEI